MDLFDKAVLIKPTDPRGDVFTFGKGSALEGADTQSGVARIGGFLRQPDYFHAYLKSAAVLVDHGVQHHALDEISLPAFYLQRHALELLIKRLLSWIYEYAEFRAEVDHDNNGVPSKRQQERYATSHNISALHEDLCCSCQHFGFTAPPEELAALIQNLKKIETTETWSRYELSRKGQSVNLHTENEIVVPIVDLQRDLEAVSKKIVSRLDLEESYEQELYYAWDAAAKAAGRYG